MKMRMPSIPLITVDPYFSVWSMDRINRNDTLHWTGARNAIVGRVSVDGRTMRFLGRSGDPEIEQVSLELDALTTTVVYRCEEIELKAEFTSPVLADELYYASRPVSYLKLSYTVLDGREHDVSAKLSASEELVLNRAGEGRAWSEEVLLDGATAVKMGSGEQKILWRSGDDVRIDWGYLYLAAGGEARVGNEVFDGLYAVYAEKKLDPDCLFAFAYDDIYCLEYFGERLEAYWKKDGRTITDAISEAIAEYDALKARCDRFSAELTAVATQKGGERYAELLSLAYRQVMAGHKLAVDTEGNNIYVSKECFSNGCAATVDVTYPSAPMYLYYNTELLKAMLRPIFRYAKSGRWAHPFAPHDVGTYPLVNGQAYNPDDLSGQMPVEECGNMIVLVSAICEREGSCEFAAENLDLLDTWSDYLVKYGLDPENQLCTDDFAGHLAHNCNLSIKAIMGLCGYSRILSGLGQTEKADRFSSLAREYASSFIERAANPDGSFRLAYDREGSFSLKYNAVWDKLWKTELFPEHFYKGEFVRYRKEALPYGVPLDDREKYTKSDWELWVGCMGEKEDFEFMVDLLYRFYDVTRDRVPMSDWYYTDTAQHRYFRHRTVMGGLFLKLLFD